MHAQQSPAERVSQIQAALRAEKLDGWLFYDFRHSDPLAYRILKLDENMAVSRRWFCYIPASGEPVKIVMSIEQFKLDSLPGKSSFIEDGRNCISVCVKCWDKSGEGSKRRIAMQYSPMNDIPYMSRVDAGTIELIHSLGVEIVSSAELVQQFEAVLSPEQYQMHIEASDKMHRIFTMRSAKLRAAFALTNQRRNTISSSSCCVASTRKGWAGADDRVGQREHGQSALHADKGKALADQARRFRAARSGFETDKPEAVFTDQTWTGYVGESVPEEYTRIFNIVREARDSAVDFVRKNIRAGKPIRGAEVDDVSRGVITRAGYGDQFTHRTGHSIGEEMHGNGVNIDNFETRDSRRIVPGVCFSIEPGIYQEGKFGVRSEIDVYFRTKTSRSRASRFRRRLFQS